MQQVANINSMPVGESTFADLLKPLIEPGFRLALAMLHDPTAAEDAVQEASFTAWRKLGRMADRGRLRPWFLGVVAN
jgi:DNA-directed RNA polymerase specialized sigma24 family protein